MSARPSTGVSASGSDQDAPGKLLKNLRKSVRKRSIETPASPAAGNRAAHAAAD